MRPFGCHVTILNTLDHLEKCDGKFNDVFFVGYSLNSKDFGLCNLRTRKVEENLHIRFLVDKLSIAGTNSNDFVGIEETIGEGHSIKEKRSSQDYILMPLWKDGSLFDSSSKNASNDKTQASSDSKHKDDEGVSNKSEIDNQEKPESSTQDVNTAGPSINTTSANVNTKVDLSNISNTYLVPSTPNKRIHKDHLLDHEEPKKVIQAQKDPSWIEAMQEELLQFKLQQVWTLVDLPYDKRAIGTKWIYRNKNDERGIVVRNKARLVAQG
nr:hypothetical protein [Tanacetum cinerariifolium]